MVDHVQVRPAVQHALWTLPINCTNGAAAFLPMFEGMCVMLTENLAMSKSLVNGMIGTIMGIWYVSNSDGQWYPTAVMVNMPGCDHVQVGLPLNTICIQPTAKTWVYQTTGRTNLKKATHSISQKFLPLLPAYTYTDYKSQGWTLHRAIVDLCGCSTPQSAYVMLSQV
ncbi:hypothetical protein DACRYDRAFT_58381 [Dacryopinax primogenitus]|uniref:Uncharacterized protein n=1 Tax=Dacryopinax primogenitus (strain DJM 731) TaxID=1858805 RepID=M5FNU2_DACPD|nr:uncharacterized protein DACRYDRAFT_58381 [Dacryopinax primogenitus]EJT97930.1 hypothetical protein DACRYDRAFT_58381 [Dacryopinax primogenitus]